MPTTTELTEQYLAVHPSIRDCLKYGVINYSKLARRVAKEIGAQKKSSMEAILVACRRYAHKIQKENELEGQIQTLLRSGSLEIKNKIVVIVVDKRFYVENLLEIERKIRKTADVFYAIEGSATFTLIVSEQYLVEVKKLLAHSIVRINRGLVMVTLKCPKELETTPGVIAYLYSLFAAYGINIAETMSCWTDTIFVVSEKDVASVMGFLSFS